MISADYTAIFLSTGDEMPRRLLGTVMQIPVLWLTVTITTLRLCLRRCNVRRSSRYCSSARLFIAGDFNINSGNRNHEEDFMEKHSRGRRTSTAQYASLSIIRRHTARQRSQTSRRQISPEANLRRLWPNRQVALSSAHHVPSLTRSSVSCQRP